MEFLKLYEVKHSGLKEPSLVVANSIEDAIRRFDKHWEYDIDIFPDGIESVNLVYDKEVIM